MNVAEAQEVPGVAVIVVAADSGPLLEKCIDHVLASPLPKTVRLFDNASRDGVPQDVAQQHADDPRLCLMHSTRNLGFGAAVNRAARGLDSEWLLILNPDLALSADALQSLLGIAASHPEAGLVGAVMVDRNGKVDPASRRRDPFLRRSLAQMGLGGGETVNDGTPIPASVIEVEAVSGALMLVRRHVFEQLDGFDEGYFLHFEDLDLCRRVRDAGKLVLLAGQHRVLHEQGSSSHHRPIFVSWHKHRGMWRWFSQHDPAARSRWTQTLVWSGIGLHFVLGLPGALWRPRSRRR